jgi:folylpolyglutamate synthase/dihydropteroate synthase
MLDLIPQDVGSVMFTEVSVLTDAGLGDFVPADQLFRYLIEKNCFRHDKIMKEANPQEALNQVIQRVNPKPSQKRPWVIVTGSLYLVGKILSLEKWYLP